MFKIAESYPLRRFIGLVADLFIGSGTDFEGSKPLSKRIYSRKIIFLAEDVSVNLIFVSTTFHTIILKQENEFFTIKSMILQNFK